MHNDTKSVFGLIHNDSFIRWVEGMAGEQEARRWDRWVSEDPEHRARARTAQQMIAGFGISDANSANDTDAEWKALQTRISMQPRSGKQKHSRRVSPIYRIFNTLPFKLAAGFLVAAISGLIALTLHGEGQAEIIDDEITWHSVTTQFEQQKTVTFSDGSTIRLNANSSLTYPKGEQTDQLSELFLEGEAYFSITPRGADRIPLLVKTDDGVIRVTGTRFAVNTDGHRTAVVLEEGEVIVTGTDASAEQQPVTMEAGQVAYLEPSAGTIRLQKVQRIDRYTAWTNHRLVLDGTSMAEIAGKVEAYYGIDVIIDEPEIARRTLTGTVKLKELDQLLQSLSDVLDVDVENNETTVRIGHANPN